MAEGLASAMVNAYTGPAGSKTEYSLPKKIEGLPYKLWIADGAKTGVLISVLGTRCGVSLGGAPAKVNLSGFPRQIKNESEENVTLFLKNDDGRLLLGRKSSCAGCIQADIHYNAQGNDCNNTDGEYVILRNGCDTFFDLSNWVLSDKIGHKYIFLQYILSPNASVTVYTGCGNDLSNHLYWCNQQGPCKAVWNNAGDILFLTDGVNQTCLRQEY
ncbi:MAG: lamin tail domain-containing protein [Candidatus Altiarchaeia archaeon]